MLADSTSMDLPETRAGDADAILSENDIPVSVAVAVPLAIESAAWPPADSRFCEEIRTSEGTGHPIYRAEIF